MQYEPSPLAVDRSPRGHVLSAVASPKVRVLVADGEALVRAGVRVLLEGSGHIEVVGEAGTGEEALTMAGRLRPDLVLIDASLPGLDPVEATRRLSSDVSAAVMLLTPSEGYGRLLDALRAGASGVLQKDSSAAELIDAVDVLASGGAKLSPRVTRRLIAELASAPEPAQASPEQLAELTAREREVMTLVALGYSNAEIAERLVVTPATAKTHVSRAMVKLHARDRAHLVVLAYRSRLVHSRAHRVPGRSCPVPARPS
jgi:DNA-binding NarL/FixJ family response regulator